MPASERSCRHDASRAEESKPETEGGKRASGCAREETLHVGGDPAACSALDACAESGDQCVEQGEAALGETVLDGWGVLGEMAERDFNACGPQLECEGSDGEREKDGAHLQGEDGPA